MKKPSPVGRPPTSTPSAPDTDEFKARMARLIQKRHRQAKMRPQTRMARAPRRTGSANHWVSQIYAVQAAKKALSKIKLIDLVPECSAMKYAAGSFVNVLSLATATNEQIRAVPGLGPARRKQLRDYLLSRRVNPAWQE